MMVVQQAELSQDKLNCAGRGSEQEEGPEEPPVLAKKTCRIAALIKPFETF